MDKLSVFSRRLVFLPVIDIDIEALNVTKDTLPVFREVVSSLDHLADIVDEIFQRSFVKKL